MADKRGRPKKPRELTDEFTISMQYGGKTYSSSGASALEALSSLEHPGLIKAAALITVQKGDLKTSQMFYPTRLKRLFYNKDFQAIQVKYLTLGLK